MTEHLNYQQAVAQLIREDGGEFPIVERTIRGVPHFVFRDISENLHDYYKACVAPQGDREFIVYDSVRLTYQEGYAQAAAVADQLVNRFGIQKGDRVAIAMRNYPEWIIAFMAVTSIGAISVSLNSWWTGEELEYGLTEVGTRLVILDQQRWERLEGRLKPLGVQAIGACWDGSLPDGITPFDDLLRDGAGQPMPGVTMDADDDATILFTSGTTGFPKGAVGTHRGILSTLAGWAFSARVRQLMGTLPTPDPAEQPEFQPSILMPLPFFHVTGCQVGILASFMMGRKIVMMYKWNAEEALRLIEEERITAFNGVPTMTWEILESPDLTRRDLRSLTELSGGGAPMPGGMVDRLIERLPDKQFALGWGMTETNAGGVNIGKAELVERPTSCGRGSPISEVKIIADDGTEMPRGEDGELVFKSPMNFRCYWNQPQATAETIVDGWLHSGDIAHLDDDGFVCIVDRKKDMILRGGENIYCAEVERIIYQHDAVYEAAVFGLPDQRLGEELAAVVMQKPGRTISKDELCDHVAKHLAAFKVPAVILFRDEQLPRGSTDKIHKRLLRQQVMEELDRS